MCICIPLGLNSSERVGVFDFFCYLLGSLSLMIIVKLWTNAVHAAAEGNATEMGRMYKIPPPALCGGPGTRRNVSKFCGY